MRPALLLVLLCWNCNRHAEAKKVKVVFPTLYPSKTISTNNAEKEVCGLDCEKECYDEHGLRRKNGGCYNLGVFSSQESFNEDKDSEKQPPVISATVSTIGAPSVVVGFCAAGKECSVSPMTTMATPENFWVAAIDNHLQLQASSNQPAALNLDMLNFGPKNRVGDSIFSFGIHLQEIIEYEDTNKDGRYTNEKDKVYQTIDMNHLAFKPMEEKHEKVKGEDYDVHSFVFETVNGEIGFVCEMTSEVDRPESDERAGRNADERMRSPNAVHCTLRLKNMIFLGKRSQLAVQLVFITPNGWSEAPFKPSSDPNTIVLMETDTSAPRGYFSWTPTALTNSTFGPHKGKGQRESCLKLSKLHAVSFENIMYSLAKSQIALSSSTTAYTAFASVSGSAFNPSQVVWDFSVGYGRPPSESSDGTDTKIFAAVFFGILIAAIGLCIATNSYFSKKLAVGYLFGGEGMADGVLGYVGGAEADKTPADPAAKAKQAGASTLYPTDPDSVMVGVPEQLLQGSGGVDFS